MRLLGAKVCDEETATPCGLHEPLQYQNIPRTRPFRLVGPLCNSNAELPVSNLWIPTVQTDWAYQAQHDSGVGPFEMDCSNRGLFRYWGSKLHCNPGQTVAL